MEANLDALARHLVRNAANKLLGERGGAGSLVIVAAVMGFGMPMRAAEFFTALTVKPKKPKLHLTVAVHTTRLLGLLGRRRHRKNRLYGHCRNTWGRKGSKKWRCLLAERSSHYFVMESAF